MPTSCHDCGATLPRYVHQGLKKQFVGLLTVIDNGIAFFKKKNIEIWRNMNQIRRALANR